MSAVVLLHASASSSAQWRSAAAALAPRHEVVAPDLIGYGAAPAWSGKGPFRLEEEAAALRPLLRRLGGPVDLVGHSYGGAVALHLARTSPELVSRLVLIEPVSFHLLRDAGPWDREGLEDFAAAAERVQARVAAGDPESAARTFIDYWSGVGTWEAMPLGKRAAVVASLAKLLLEIEAVLGEPARAEDARRVAVPVLLMQGGHTRLSTQRVCQRLVQVLPEVAVAVVPRAGHMLPLTHRDEVNALVARFLHSPTKGKLEWTRSSSPRLRSALY